MPKPVSRLVDVLVANELRTNATKATPQGELVAPGDYGEIWVEGNTDETALPVGIWVQYTGFANNGESRGAIPDHTNNHITIRKAGKYLVTASLTIESASGTGAVIRTSVFKNNGAVEYANIHAHRAMATGGGDDGSLSLSGIGAFEVGDTVELWIKNDTNSVAATGEAATLSVVQVELAVGAGAPRGPKGDRGTPGGLEVVDSIDLSSVQTINFVAVDGFDYKMEIPSLITTNDSAIVFIRFNGDGTVSYTYRVERSNAATDPSGAATEIRLNGASGVGSAAQEEFGPCTIKFGNLASATRHKRATWTAGWTNTTGTEIAGNGHGVWESTAVVTSITIDTAGGFDAGVATLYRSSRT